MPSASPLCASIAGRKVRAAPDAPVPRWSRAGDTTRSRIANVIAARRALGASTTSPARWWPGIASQPLRVWLLCLSFMGLKLSNLQIAGDLGVAVSDVQAILEQRCPGLAAKTPGAELAGEVEIDEVYMFAEHKGQPDDVAKRDGAQGIAGWQARRDAARWRKTNHAHSWPDPARWPGGPAYAGQCASRHDQADHHRSRRPRCTRPHRRA